MEEAYEDQQFVEFIVKSIVDNPDHVKTVRVVDEMGVLITLDVDPADMGQVIGRNGQTAKSIRTLLKVVGAKHNARVNLKINEPEGGKRAKEEKASEEAAPAAAAPAAEAPAAEPAKTMDPIDDIAKELDL